MAFHVPTLFLIQAHLFLSNGVMRQADSACENTIVLTLQRKEQVDRTK
jgi:predicted DNA-binding helix-hairpin-helix protein